MALIWCSSWSGLAFLMFAIDKFKAQFSGGNRVPEIHLLIISAIGGWPGGWLAMRLFRHKTIKKSFRFRFFLALLPFSMGIWGWWHWR